MIKNQMTGRDWDGEAFNDCLARAGRVREGYWSAFVTLAWIASRCEAFVSATQIYEEENYASRGGLFTAAAWNTLNNEAGSRYGLAMSEAVGPLREALEAGHIPGGIARPQPADRSPRSKFQPIEPYQWKDWQRAFESDGLSLIPGLVDFAWPAEAVRRAFPISAGPVETGGVSSQVNKCFPDPLVQKKTARPTKPLSRRPGPKSKFKEKLFEIFKQRPGLLKQMSEKEMLTHVTTHWPDDNPPASARTVAAYWKEWSEARLSDVAKSRAELGS